MPHRSAWTIGPIRRIPMMPFSAGAMSRAMFMLFFSTRPSSLSSSDQHNKRMTPVNEHFLLPRWAHLMFVAYTRVKLGDIANGSYKNASYLTYNAHTEWTRKGWIPNLIVRRSLIHLSSEICWSSGLLHLLFDQSENSLSLRLDG